MKAKKVLFTTSGVLRLVACGCLILLFGLILLLGNTIKQAFLNDYSYIEGILQELVAEDPSYEYLLSAPHEEVINMIMQPIIYFSIFMLISSCVGIVFGVFNLIFAKKYDNILKCNTRNKVIFIVFEWIFGLGLASNILSTIAVFLKDKPSIDNAETTNTNNPAKGEISQ